jgi:hypothetical protein
LAKLPGIQDGQIRANYTEIVLLGADVGVNNKKD